MSPPAAGDPELSIPAAVYNGRIVSVARTSMNGRTAAGWGDAPGAGARVAGLITTTTKKTITATSAEAATHAR